MKTLTIPQTPTQVPVRRIPASTFAANLQQGVDNASFLKALAFLEGIKQFRTPNKADLSHAAGMLVYLPTVPEKPRSLATPNLYR